MNSIAPYAKAFIGALVGALAALSQALDDGGVTLQEWVGVAIALLGGLGLVFAVPNRDPKAEHQDESVQPPQAGEVGLVPVLVVVVLVILLVILLGGFR